MKVKIKQRSFIGGALYEPGEYDLPEGTVLSEHMEKMAKPSPAAPAPRPVPTFAKPPEPIKPPAPRAGPPDKVKPSGPETFKANPTDMS